MLNRANTSGTQSWSRWTGAVLVLVLTLVIGLGPAHAQGDEQVQVLTGRVQPGDIIVYSLPDLEQGQTFYAYFNGTSGNLDPFLVLLEAGADVSALRQAFYAEVAQATAEGRDPFLATAEIADQYFLAWDDDSDQRYDAALEYAIPADGTYELLAISPAQARTFGDYRLTIGLNAPQVLSGQAEPTGDVIAVLESTSPVPICWSLWLSTLPSLTTCPSSDT